jgi:hypothetical protein
MVIPELIQIMRIASIFEESEAFYNTVDFFSYEQWLKMLLLLCQSPNVCAHTLRVLGGKAFKGD